MCATVSAQNLSYDFEQCNVGDKVAATLGDPWTTWDMNPGGVKDAFVSDEHALGNRSVKIDNGNDLVLKFGENTEGAYQISLDMYIPEGKESYFNLLHVFDGSNSVWAQQFWFKSQDYGNYCQYGTYMNFDVPFDEWFHIDVTVSLDEMIGCMKINDELINVWNFQNSMTNKSNALAGINFYPPGQEDKNGFFVDNVMFTKLEGTYASHFVPVDETLNILMQKDDIDTITTGIVNEGNVIHDAIPWLYFSPGEDEGEEETLHYDSEPYWYYGGYSEDPYLEAGIWFNADYLLDSLQVVGMKITKIQCFLSFAAQIGMTGPLTVRVYNWTMGDPIAEKSFDDYVFGVWNTFELDEPVPVDGHHLLVTVGFQQVDGGYPLSLDAGPSRRYYGDLIKFGTGAWYSLNELSEYYGSIDYGNHNIRVVCEGTPVETHWLSMVPFPASQFYTYVEPGKNLELQLVIDTHGLEYGEYLAEVYYETAFDKPVDVAVPIRLKVSGASVDESLESKCRIYPNPVKDVVCIEGEDARFAVIYNTSGAMVGIVKVDGNAIDVNELGNGVYFVCILNSKGEKNVQKMVVSK